MKSVKLQVHSPVHAQTSLTRGPRRRHWIGGMCVALAATVACGAGQAPASHPQSEPDPDALLANDDADAVVPASSPDVKKAMDAISAKDYAGAKALLAPVVADKPDDVQAVFYLGVAEAALGDAEPAVGHFEKALELDPKFIDASLNLSALYLDMQKYEDAVAAAEQGLKHAPKDLGLLQNKGLALSYSGQQAQAVEPLKFVVEKKPDDEGLRFTLADALFGSGDAEGAQQQLAKLKNSSSREVLASVADVYGRLKQWDDCVAALDSAIDKEPAAELLTSRGLCKHGKADEDGAKADFDAAIKLDPSFAKAHFYLGHNLRERGNKKGAKAAFLKAAELSGPGKLADAAKAAAAKL